MHTEMPVIAVSGVRGGGWDQGERALVAHLSRTLPPFAPPAPAAAHAPSPSASLPLFAQAFASENPSRSHCSGGKQNRVKWNLKTASTKAAVRPSIPRKASPRQHVRTAAPPRQTRHFALAGDHDLHWHRRRRHDHPHDHPGQPSAWTFLLPTRLLAHLSSRKFNFNFSWGGHQL